MTKFQAINNFWNNFGIPAYDENTVPTNAVMPYITYEVSVGSINNPLVISASIWYRSNSWVAISDKAEEIVNGIDGKQLLYDDGSILLFAGNPKYTRTSGDNDTIRRIVLNITMEFIEI